MEKSLQEISEEIETKDDYLEMATSNSDCNLLLESNLRDSTSSEKLTYTDTNKSIVRYKRKNNLEDQVLSKKQKDITEINLSEEMRQVSAIEENPSMNINEERVPEDMTDNVTLMNQSGESGITNINPYEYEIGSETTYFSRGTLCFVKPNSSVRSKPLNCKTIFVNCLPQKITEGIIKEIFQRCGSIEAIKMAGSESCYVTFSDGISAELAMRFSGYRLNIDEKKEVPYSRILFIDYAEAEFDRSCLTHSQYANNSIIPSYTDTRFSEYETKILNEKLKNENTFYEAFCKLTDLLKQKRRFRKDTVGLFPLIHNIYCHVLFLEDKKGKFELGVTKSKSDLVQHIKETCQILVDIENAFKLSQQKIYQSYFTRRQRKYIKLYEKHCKEYRTLFTEELASYENSLNEQKDQSKENIEARENEVSMCDLEDSDGQIQENFFSPMTSYFARFSNNAVSFICESLNREETFTQAAGTIIRWLEQDECYGENAASFFSMLECIHNQVIKLRDNKNEYEENLQYATETLIEHLKEILCSLLTVEQIYFRVSLEQCSNHFTSSERQNIEQWKKHAKELKLAIKRKIRELRKKDETAKFYKELNDNIKKIQDDHSSLRAKFQELMNDIEIVKGNYKKQLEYKDKQITAVCKALRKSQARVFQLQIRCLANEREIRELRNSIYQQNIGHESANPSVLSQDQARIISLVCIFLSIQPGASIDSINSYLHGIDATIDTGSVENLMRRLPTTFQEEVTVVGTNLQKKWYSV